MNDTEHDPDREDGPEEAAPGYQEETAQAGDPPEGGLAASDGPRSEDGSWWTRRSRRAKIGLVAIVVLGVVIVALVLTFSQPNDYRSYEHPVSAETRTANSALMVTLARAGINESMADVTDERVYVAYTLPAYAYGNGSDVDGTNGSEVNATTAVELQRFVVGAAVNAAPDVPRIVVLQYDGTDPRVAWDVQTSDFAAYVSGDLTLEEFESRIEITRFDDEEAA